MSEDQWRETALRQQAELDSIKAAQREATVEQAITAAIRDSGVPLKPGVQEQVATLLRPSVILASAEGKTIPAGPGLRALPDFVRERLSAPEYAHFVAGRPSAPRVGGEPLAAIGVAATALRMMTAPPVPGRSDYGAGTVQGGELNMGQAMLAHHMAQRQNQPDAAVDVSQKFGLRRIR